MMKHEQTATRQDINKTTQKKIKTRQDIYMIIHEKGFPPFGQRSLALGVRGFRVRVRVIVRVVVFCLRATGWVTVRARVRVRARHRVKVWPWVTVRVRDIVRVRVCLRGLRR
jgi:hypothetical protein